MSLQPGPPADLVVLCDVGGQAERIRTRFPSLQVLDISEDLPGHARGDVLFGGYSERSTASMGRGVRWVQALGTGVDGLPPEVRRAEVLTCAPGSSAVAISEYVLAAMGAFARGFPQNWLRAVPEQWNYQPASLLTGRTLGLFGFGGIAQRVARIALAMEMSVLALRRRTGPSPVAGVAMAASPEELLGAADHLVLAAPATALTRRVINADSLRRCKPGLHLVNIARGSLVDQDALRAALDDGTVARASLDVVDPEPLPAGHWMYDHPKVFLTPHSSWVGPPPFQAATEAFCDNLARYLAGQPLENVVGDEGY
jgi:phosphoglycerate dehydrogenase-like enzyme